MLRRMLTGTALAVLLISPTGAQASISVTSDATGGTNGRVDAILVHNGVTYVGGSFTSVFDRSGHSFARNNLAAFNSNGNPTAWNPNVNGEVRALAANGSTIFAGGSFSSVAGKGAMNIAAINQAGARIWGGGVGGTVRAVRYANGKVFIGGVFLQVQGAHRARLASLMAATGRVNSWNPHANAAVYALAATGTRIFVGGAFTAIGGTKVAHLVDLTQTTGARIRFASHPAYPVTALALGTHLYVAGAGPGGRVAAYSTAGARIWVRITDGAAAAVTVAGGQVVFGGHFNNVCKNNLGGGTPFSCTTNIVREHLLATLPSGALLTWNPKVNSTLGVFAVRAGSSNVWAGGDFTSVGTATRNHLTRFAYK
jgi:hypothetical protein